MRMLERIVAIAGLCLAAIGARAQTVEEFYRGRTVTVIVYSGPGSTYEMYARLLARHLGNHIPGKPTFIVQNMVGAGGLKAVDYLNRIAPKDGSVFGTISRGNPFEPAMGKTDIAFDPLKFNWLGSMNREVALGLSWHTTKVKTFEDARRLELIVPGTGAGADSEILPRAFNNLTGTKFRIVSGYKDTTEAALLMETGEIDGIAYWSWSSIMSLHPDWVRDKKINLLFQTGSRDFAEAPGLPRIREMAANDTDRRALDFLLAREPLGRPFVAPPGIPADRAKALRDAFAATMRDPAFLADAKRGNIEVELVPGAEVETILRDAVNAPSAVIDRVKKIIDR